MRNIGKFRLVVFLGVSSVTALGFGQAQSVVAREAPVSAGCPVVVTAKYVPGATIRPVQPDAGGVERQPLHVSFGPLAAKQELKIEHAQVTVRGMTEKGGVIPAGVSASSPWLQKTFTVDVAMNAAGVLSSTVWLSGFGSVSDVRVDSITYANGTVWNVSAEEKCHAPTGALLRSSK
jgi:hypothetical protein